MFKNIVTTVFQAVVLFGLMYVLTLLLFVCGE